MEKETESIVDSYSLSKYILTEIMQDRPIFRIDRLDLIAEELRKNLLV